jgi:hypothetical protein
MSRARPHDPRANTRRYTHDSKSEARLRRWRASRRTPVQILGLTLIGIVLGLVARLVLPGRQRIGVGLTVLLGVGGALVGAIVASALGAGDIF